LNWQTRTYALGIIVGAVLGFISAYMFNRAAEENDEHKPQPIPTMTMIGLLASAISLVRQIAESGKQRKK
jgi:H+/Cl- antiporter ClcA